MKNILVVLALFICSTVSAEKFLVENKIPHHVAFRFHYQFPGATDVRWQKKDLNYIATFIESGKQISVYYDNNSDCIELDREISSTELPQYLRNRITEQLDQKIQFSKITSFDDFSGNPYYIIEVSNNDKKYTLEIMTINGEELILCDLRQGTVVWK